MDKSEMYLGILCITIKGIDLRVLQTYLWPVILSVHLEPETVCSETTVNGHCFFDDKYTPHPNSSLCNESMKQR